MNVEEANDLIRQTSKDLEISCFDKAVSAAYFSARMAVEVFLAERRLRLPRRDDKLANLLKRQGFSDACSTGREATPTIHVEEGGHYGPNSTDEERAREALD